MSDYEKERRELALFQLEVRKGASLLSRVLILERPTQASLWLLRVLFHSIVAFCLVVIIVQTSSSTWRWSDTFAVGAGLAVAVLVQMIYRWLSSNGQSRS